MAFARFYVPDVRGLGNVAVSRHAQAQAEADSISEEAFHEVLRAGKDTPDGLTTVWRELNGIRLVILRRPEPFRGACLVATVYRVERQATARREN